jgi:ABC-type polysaccharide/polyol phosphate export permease
MRNRRKGKSKTAIVPAIAIGLFIWFIIRQFTSKAAAGPTGSAASGGTIPGYSDLY